VGNVQNEGELVNCALNVVSLDDRPKYTSLSYVWGRADNPKQVVVNGTVVEITTNLEEALRYLQQEFEPVVLWADALCINQNDKPEKSQQVQLMRHIYENASEVFVWLGPDDETSNKALDFLGELGEQAANIGIFGLELPDIRNILSPNTRESLEDVKKSLENMVQRYILKIPWLDLNQLFSHSWFSRVWVLQELAVSRDGAATMSCGSKRLPFRYFSASLLFIAYFRIRGGVILTKQDFQDPQTSQFWSEMNRYNSNRASRAHASRRMYQEEGNSNRESLFQLLVRTHVVYTVVDTIQATDPRDRIYAFLGMAKEELGPKIVPDYTKLVAKVFTEAAEVILGCGEFDLLNLNQDQDPDKKTELPSWAPDWNSYIQRPCGGFKEDRCYEACGPYKPVIAFQSLPDGRRILKIKGCLVDTITKVGEKWMPTPSDWQDWTHSHARCSAFFESIAAFCAESDKLDCNIYKHPSQRLEACWRVPCANKARTQSAPCRPSASGAELLEGYTIIKNGGKQEGLTEVQSLHEVNFRVTMGDEFKRRPFISTQGYVGLAPSHSKPDDVVCIFYGCIKPFVLRRSGTGYKLLGEAYVHGIMDGEFTEKSQDAEMFVVC
jgi:hypothetical protein